MFELHELAFVGLAAVAAGAVNALAGGGTLITFPALLAVGVPALAANVTNTVALCPGFVGGALAQRRDLRGQRRRLGWALPAGFVGGIAGGALLLLTGERIFRAIAPFLILFAAVLLAAQNPMRRWVLRRAARAHGHSESERAMAALAGLGAIYGGYFGAGLGVIALAALGLTLDDTMTRLNALKQAFSLAVNVAAALFFLFSGHIVWPAAAAMAAGALVGGALGGRLAGWVRPDTLRWSVVVIGTAVGAIYWARL